jgi:hypothetical protein
MPPQSEMRLINAATPASVSSSRQPLAGDFLSHQEIIFDPRSYCGKISQIEILQSNHRQEVAANCLT